MKPSKYHEEPTVTTSTGRVIPRHKAIRKMTTVKTQRRDGTPGPDMARLGDTLYHQADDGSLRNVVKKHLGKKARKAAKKARREGRAELSAD